MAASSGNNFQGSISFDVSQAITELQKLQDKYTQLQTAIANKSYSPAVLNSLELELARVNTQIQTLQTNVNSAGKSLENNLTAPSYNSFRAIGSLDRVTREFASGGLQQGANGLVMFGNSLSRMAMMEGSVSGAFKSMGAALTGPAGIVLGFSLLVGILEANKDKIADFFKSPKTNADAYKDALKGIGTEFTNAAEKVLKVQAAFDEYHKGIITGKEALRIYNEELGKNFGIKTNINEAEDTFNKKTNDYINASFQRALADSAAKKASEELLKQKLLERKSLSEYKGFVSGATLSGSIDVLNYKDINNRTAQGFKDVEINTQKDIVKLYQDIYKTAQEEADKLSQKGGIVLIPEKTNTTKPKKEVDYIQKLINKSKEPIGKIETVPEDTTIQDLEKQHQDYLDYLSKFYKFKINLTKKDYEENQKILKKQEQDIYAFADKMSSSITNSIGNVWDALQKGDNVFKTLSDEVMKFAENLGLAIIKAQILAAIQGAITIGGGGVGAAAGGGGFWDLIMSLMGMGGASSGLAFNLGGGGGAGGMSTMYGDLWSGFHAEGGITTKPSLGMIGEAGPEAIMPLDKLKGFLNTSFSAGAMSGQSSGGNGQFVLKGQDLILAINRSNASLNLRRGF